MDATRWDSAERIFHACLELDGSFDEAGFLAQECGGDEELFDLVRTLLQAHRSDPDFLLVPVARLADPLTEGGLEAPATGSAPQVEGYRLIRRLGRGGMGEVFLAIQEGAGFERSVALKLIQAGMDSDDLLGRFRLERRILAGLEHPNIARLLDGGVASDGRPYLAMEYVEGVPLDRFCDERRLDVDARVALFGKVCAAVQYAHENLVLHRDLKAANVLVRDDGTPKLVDFGIAKLLTPDPATETEVTLTRARALTPEYAAPEQLRGDAVSAATDVYGLGVLLYELLTGVRPFRRGEGTWRELERAVLQDDPPRASVAVTAGENAGERAGARGTEPGSLARRLSGDLDTILAKALRKEPGRRYTSVSAFAGDLSRHRNRLPVHARPDTVRYRTGRFVRRNWVPLAAGAVVAIALISATVVSTVQSRRAVAERDKALEVQGFLLEMFGATGADREVGSTITARELLDRQAATLDHAFAGRPDLRAEMTRVLAEGYDRLGLLEPAEELAAEAVRLRHAAAPADATELARAEALLGWIRHEQGDAQAADSLLRRAVIALEGDRGAGRDLARALNDLGVTREAAGELEEAESLYARALELRRRLQGEDHRAVGVTASNLSVIRYRRADYAGAVAAAEEALAILQRALGPDHQRSTIVQGNLAAMQLALGDDRGAEAQYRALLARQESVQGPEHPVTLQLLFSLGSVLNSLGEWEEAEATLRRLVDARSRTLGEAHPQTASARLRLAQSLSGSGRHAEAREWAEPALVTLEGAVGREHVLTSEALRTLAEAWAPTDPTRAESMQREAIRILVELRGEDHPITADAQVGLADILASTGRWAEAVPLYEGAHVTFTAALPEGHRNIERARRLLESARLADARARGETTAEAELLPGSGTG